MKLIFELIENNSFHQDLIMKAPSLNIVKAMDSYYFWPTDSKYGKERIDGIKNIKKYFNQVRNRLSMLEIKEKLFIPVDFSDQYFGGFMISKISSNTILASYGFIDDINTAVIESQNNQTYNNLVDKNFIAEFTFESEIESFKNSFYLQ